MQSAVTARALHGSSPSADARSTENRDGPPEQQAMHCCLELVSCSVFSFSLRGSCRLNSCTAGANVSVLPSMPPVSLAWLAAGLVRADSARRLACGSRSSAPLRIGMQNMRWWGRVDREGKKIPPNWSIAKHVCSSGSLSSSLLFISKCSIRPGGGVFFSCNLPT